MDVTQIPSHTHYPAERVLFWDASYANSFAYSGLNWNGNDLYFGAKSSVPVGNTGGGEAHNNLAPFIVVYGWKRTA